MHIGGKRQRHNIIDLVNAWATLARSARPGDVARRLTARCAATEDNANGGAVHNDAANPEDGGEPGPIHLLWCRSRRRASPNGFLMATRYARSVKAAPRSTSRPRTSAHQTR